MANENVSLTSLKKQRTALKTKFTKFINFLNDKSNENKIREIKTRLDKIESILEQFENIHSQIIDITGEETSDLDDFENLYFQVISRAHDLIEMGSASSERMPINTQVPYQNVKLPKIELATFDGTYDKWLDFYNSFKQTIHDESNLAKIHKLQYLKSCLKGEAVSVISALELTEENYEIAWDLLKNRYDNKRVIVQNHVKALFELQNIWKESSGELRTLTDTIRTHLRALKSIGEPVDTWDTLLIYVITSKLDRNTHKEWEKSVKGTDMPKMEGFMTFLEERCQVLQFTALNVSSKTKDCTKTQSHNSKKQIFTTTRSAISCIICKKSHHLYSCEAFRELNVTERIQRVKAARYCINCLRPGHRSPTCSWSGCKKCNKKHNTLLHISNVNENNARPENSGNTIENANIEENATTSNAHITACSATVYTQVLLSTALINIRGKNGKMFQARVLLDSGSQSNFITTRFADLLQLPKKSVDLPVVGLNQLETRIRYSICTEIQSHDENYTAKLEFLVSPRICNNLPNEFINKAVLNIPKNIRLADPTFNQPREIDALLGVEIFYNLMCVGHIEIPGHKASLNKTELGWIISGAISTKQNLSKPRNCMLSFNSLHESLKKFWEIEHFESKTFLSEEEFQVEEHFKQTTKRDAESGRYIVRLPFNEKIIRLGDSRKSSEKQFYSLERKLEKNTTLKAQYVGAMREAISLGHMLEIKPQQIAHKHCFLPHHAVVKESSSTTKLRIVYNASAKTSTGISLNDCLKVGPVVQNTSFDIILRFRSFQIVLVADIEKMFKQIQLDERDMQYQLILWREQVTDKLKTFVIPVVLFGSASAPHTATRVLKQLADDENSRFPIASKVLKRDCYVDDVITGTDTLEEAKLLRDELRNLTNAGGFKLRKWVSNNPGVIDTMSRDNLDMNLIKNDSHTKTLGIQWDNINDSITYTVTENFDSKITKRTVLSNIARLYDPIGLIGPVIVSAKILMQKLWKCSSGWDESLPHTLQTEWVNINQQLIKLSKINFKRKTIIQDAKLIEIHGFCDASERAYGACIYIRSVNNSGKIFTNLLCSKNRIAPLNTISLPKLELCAALLLSRLINLVLQALVVNIHKIYLWSDSSITLQWIHTSPHLLKTFVANRVSEIRNITKSMHWRHVPTQDNAADILSRGQLPADFVENHQWKVGPKWLEKDESQWPKSIAPVVPLSELRVTNSFTTAVKHDSLLRKYSTFTKLKRVVAYIMRFKNNTLKDNAKFTGPLSVEEINNALIKILKLIQDECFRIEIKDLSQTHSVKPNSTLRALSPFLDDNGLIRVGGRLKNSSLHYSEKHPIILPKNHHVTTLIIREQHIVNFHSGTQATLYAVRSKYWPINGKNTIKAVINKCITCFRSKPTDYTYFMGDLPRNRVTQTRPFLNAGIDYCGPFYIKEKKFRNRGKVKVYACIFVCFATKAVHIELVSDLTTEAFLGSLRKFFARRGLSQNLYSDNATNFVGAKNEIEAFTKLIKSQAHNDDVTNFLTNKGIKWHFSPPRSPHFGGLWEAAVKSFKYHFYRVVGDKLFTYEELEVYTYEIEAILNSRPITPLSADPNDLRALTPGHFLIGDALTNLPSQDFTDIPSNRLSSWQHIQRVKQHFWKRWYKEYLNQLNVRPKWQLRTGEDIKIGSMVLLKEDNTPPLHWPLGRICEVFPGDDGKVRVISVKTIFGTYKRSITRVAPLPIEG